MQLLGFSADPAEWRTILSCSVNFTSLFSVWDCILGKAEGWEVRRGSGEPKATGESLNCDWVPVKLGPNLIKLLDITPSL